MEKETKKIVDTMYDSTELLDIIEMVREIFADVLAMEPGQHRQ